MKKNILLSVITFWFIGCSGGGGSSDINNTTPTEYQEITDDISNNNTNIDPIQKEETEKIEDIEEKQKKSEPSVSTIDPFRKYAWHIEYPSDIDFIDKYNINGQSSAKISEAWEITQGEGVIVAIIDNNFDVTHEDLRDNIISSYYSVTKTSDVSKNIFDISHGTSTTGLIIASSNSLGSLGVAPKAKIIVIKDNEYISDIDTIEAFDYAQRNGAKVINCSWGTNNVSDGVANKIKKLYDDGITIVFASGNEANSLDRPWINDESELDWVIGVGSSNEYNTKSSYSSYGSNIDILAPAGEKIGVVSTNDLFGDMQDNTNLLNSKYIFFEGTSAASPIVTGIVALMYSVNPNITPKQVRDIIIDKAQKIGDVSYDSNGWNELYSYGKIDALASVLEAKDLN